MNNINLDNGTVTVDGNTYASNEAYEICRLYEIMTTARYIRDEYDKDDDVAIDMAERVREIMADYPGTTEEEAIDEILEEDKYND